jgi:hypothetical protein
MAESEPEQAYLVEKEDVIEQRTISFFGDDMITALTKSGIYITLPGMCKAMGLNTQAQMRSILNTNKLRIHLRSLTLKTRGGLQEVNCSAAQQVPMWLIGIESSKAKPAFQAKIDLFHDRLAPKAMRVFQDVVGMRDIVPVMTAPAVVADPAVYARLVQQYDELAGLVLDLHDHVLSLARVPDQLEHALRMLESLAERQDETEHAIEKLEAKTAGLTPAQLAKVREAIEIIARDSEGKPTAMDYAGVYRALYRRFKVNSYKAIPTTRFDEAMTYLRDLWRNATSGAVPEQSNLI